MDILRCSRKVAKLIDQCFVHCVCIIYFMSHFFLSYFFKKIVCGLQSNKSEKNEYAYLEVSFRNSYLDVCFMSQNSMIYDLAQYYYSMLLY